MGEAERPPSLDEDEGREGRRGRLRPPTGAAGAVKMTDEMLGMVDVLLSDWVVAGVEKVEMERERETERGRGSWKEREREKRLKKRR